MSKLIGVRNRHDSWYYKVKIGQDTYHKSGFVCPAIASAERITLLKEKGAYSYTCLDCKKVFDRNTTSIFTNKRLRCEKCMHTYYLHLQRLRRKKIKESMESVRKVVQEVKFRTCLRCDKKFPSISAYNRVCIKCLNSKENDRVTHRLVLGR